MSFRVKGSAWSALPASRVRSLRFAIAYVDRDTVSTRRGDNEARGAWSWLWSYSCSWLYRGFVVVSAVGLLFTEAIGVGVGA